MRHRHANTIVMGAVSVRCPQGGTRLSADYRYTVVCSCVQCLGREGEGGGV